MNLRQIKTFVSVYEEGSFSGAAKRDNATQSGLSMQIRNLEDSLQTRLFDRTAKGVEPTFAGERLYRHATEILRGMDEAKAALAALGGEVSGPFRVGLVPTLTQGPLAPALAEFVTRHPEARVSIMEAYSARLAEYVLDGTIDCAVIASQPVGRGLRATPFFSDTEMLVSNPASGLGHLAPVRLGDLGPLKLVLSDPENRRRGRLDTYFAAHGVQVESTIELNSMVATLEFVAQTDWMTILPATICVNDMDGQRRKIHPIDAPSLPVDTIIIEPRSRAMPGAARIFLDVLRDRQQAVQDQWLALTDG